jgi:hypothetical protein
MRTARFSLHWALLFAVAVFSNTPEPTKTIKLSESVIQGRLALVSNKNQDCHGIPILIHTHAARASLITGNDAALCTT